MRTFIIATLYILFSSFMSFASPLQVKDGEHIGVFFYRWPSESGNCIVRPFDEEAYVEMRCTPEQQKEMKLSMILKYTFDADGSMRVIEVVETMLLQDSGYAAFSVQNGCSFKFTNVTYNMNCELAGIPGESGYYDVGFVYHFQGVIYLYRYTYLEPKGHYSNKLMYLSEQEPALDDYCAFDAGGDTELYRCDNDIKAIFEKYPYPMLFNYTDYADFKRITAVKEPVRITTDGYFVAYENDLCKFDTVKRGNFEKSISLSCSNEYLAELRERRGRIEFEYIDNDGDLILIGIGE